MITAWLVREERDESDGDDKDEVDDDVLVQMVNDKRAGFHRKHFNDFHFKRIPKKHLQINLLVICNIYKSISWINIILREKMMRNDESLIKQVKISLQKVLQNIEKQLFNKQGQIHGISRSLSLLLPAKKKSITDGRTNGRTNRLTDKHTLL